jgi:putative oxidoreductase
MARLIALETLRGGTDAAVLITRLAVGAFLIWGVWDNITSAEHMRTFVTFLRQHGFPAPEVLAPFDVGLQFAIGLAFILGLGARWAGLLCMLNFIIAIVMVDRFAGIRASFPALSLVLIGLILATYGPGRFSLDALLFPRRLRR